MPIAICLVAKLHYIVNECHINLWCSFQYKNLMSKYMQWKNGLHCCLHLHIIFSSNSYSMNIHLLANGFCHHILADSLNLWSVLFPFSVFFLLGHHYGQRMYWHFTIYWTNISIKIISNYLHQAFEIDKAMSFSSTIAAHVADFMKRLNSDYVHVTC